MNIYKDSLKSHSLSPRNFGRLELPCISNTQIIANCGDSIEVDANISDSIVTKIAFTSKGCMLSKACTSMISEIVLKKTIDDILKIDSELVQKLIGMNLGPNRLKCAMLGLYALQEDIIQYKQKG